MAEGDSIHRLARRLDDQLRSAFVHRVENRTRLDAPALIGLTLAEVRPVGKHLLMRFTGRRAMTLHSHLRMQGRWTVFGTGKRWPRALDETMRLALHLADGRTLAAFSVPVLDLVETDREHEVIGHLGPDVLAEDFSIEMAVERFHRDDVPIVQALLDQRNVCGIGNLWAVESLFLRGVFPWMPVSSVDITALLTLNRKMMRYSKNEQPGMITTGSTKRGETHWVYGRKDRPCRRCGTLIAFRPGGRGPYDRETWWCPHCQPQDNG